MHNFRAHRTICLGFILFVAGACDTGSKSKTPEDLAADSALRADLALANRDTLLVDSIGRYPSVEGPLADTGKLGSATGKASAPIVPPAAPAATSSPSTVVRTPPSAVRNPLAVVHKPAPAVRKASTVSRVTVPRATGGNPCDSPALADQKTCLRTELAKGDQRLDGIYRSLIVEIRRKGDPSAVEKLRQSQRAWLDTRDAECRRRGRGKEGTLWAYPRVHCLAQFSDQRANELADQFSRLTAH